MADNPPTFSFDWRPEEHAEVTALLVREQFQSGFRRAFRWGVVVILVSSLVVAVASFAMGDVASALRLVFLAALVASFLAGFPSIVGRLQSWRVGRNDPNVGHPIRHEFHRSGLHIGMRTLDAELKWSGIHKVRETPTMFLFHYSKHMAYFLPKRVVGSPDDIRALSGWIRNQLPAGVPFLGPETGV